MKEGPVWTLSINAVPAMGTIWEQIKALCYVPADFDWDEFLTHINQDHLAAASDAIDSVPSAELIAKEFLKRDAYLAAPKRKYAWSTDQIPAKLPDTSGKPRVSPESGVVRLGPGMDWGRRLALRDRLTNFFGGQVLESGNFLYPPGGFKEWHTNMDGEPGWRMYVIHKGEGRSFFRYVCPDTMQIKTIEDEDGQINIFRVGPDLPFWHAVKSVDAHRYSKGFIIPDSWMDTLESHLT